MTRLNGEVKKGWGSENIWVTNDKYCSKFMSFEEGASFSMHFHKDKEETWLVVNGEFVVDIIDTRTAEITRTGLPKDSVWHNPPMVPHKLTCIKGPGLILEVSTPDSIEDNYRVMPGDSQKNLS